ncbi:MAG TPA: isoamylase early set domain-containing protein [bacterium]|nr:isoamylase early set domain-containing protein [bacterium]
MMTNLVMVSPVTGSVQEVAFRFDARHAPKAKWVALVGSFNRWDTAAHRMKRGPDGAWRITLTLAPGEYPYLFIVDGVPWNDPLDDRRVPCEWGGQYSVRVVR